MKPFLLALVYLSVSASAQAQSLTLARSVYLGVAAGDWISTARTPPGSVYDDPTYRGGHRFHVMHEDNPLTGWLETKPRPVMVAVGAAEEVATYWAIQRFLGHEHPKWARAVMYGVAAIRVGLIVNNERLNAQFSGMRRVR